MTKYQKYFRMMLRDNEKAFGNFRELHRKYELDDTKWQKDFNCEGEKILEIVREYEARVVRNTERGQYIKFSSKLSDKFMDEVRKEFPMIDMVGVEIEEPEDFSIPKITV